MCIQGREKLLVGHLQRKANPEFIVTEDEWLKPSVKFFRLVMIYITSLIFYSRTIQMVLSNFKEQRVHSFVYPEEWLDWWMLTTSTPKEVHFHMNFSIDDVDNITTK